MAAERVAFRRVATLVASGASPPAIFCAIAKELAQLFGASVTLVLRFEDDGTATVVGGWCEAGVDIPVGTRLTVEGEGVATIVRRTGRPAVTDCFDGPPGSIPARLRSVGARAGVASPIIVEGRLWGVAVAAASCPELLPVGGEVRLDDFTALVGTAIANAQARAELRGIADEQAALRRVATLVAEAESVGIDGTPAVGHQHCASDQSEGGAGTTVDGCEYCRVRLRRGPRSVGHQQAPGRFLTVRCW